MMVAMILSILVGGFVAHFGFLPEVLTANSSELSNYCLYLLLLLIGYDMGRDKSTISRLLGTDLYAFLVPIAVIIGTLSGGYVASMVLDMHVKEGLAVSAGFGWYSLSAVMIADMHSADLGAIAFLANVFRELMSIVLVPVIAKYVGPYAAIAPGGATTMDTTLPIIERYAGTSAALVAFINGVVLSSLVPVLVPLILNS